MKLSGRRLILVGFVVVLLIGIPLTLFFLQKQQEVRSRAEKSTTVSFSPDSSQTKPLQKNVGDTIPLDITVNPGKNLVSFVKLEIQYDPDKLQPATSNAFQANTSVFPSVLEGPIYSTGKIAVTLSVGPDPTKSIQQTAKAGTVTFKAVANTAAGTPTLVTYGATTQVLSIGSNDQASENVLSTAVPAAIVIGGAGPSGEPTVPIPSGSPTPTTEVPTNEPTAVPTIANVTQVPSPTSGGGTGGGNLSPVCSTLGVDRATTGTAPYSVTFTTSGSDPDGSISKATFNFGDGQVSDITSAGGIGTNSVNVQVAHTYNNPGTFQASAILTDNNNAVSSSDTCKQTITVTATGSATIAPTQVVVTSAPNVTVAPTGSTEIALGIGLTAFLLMIGGGLLFFIL